MERIDTEGISIFDKSLNSNYQEFNFNDNFIFSLLPAVLFFCGKLRQKTPMRE